MRTQVLYLGPVTGKRLELPFELAAALRRFPSRLRRPSFWLVQAMVALITLLHYGLATVTEHRPPYDNLHPILPILYAFPIVYASLRFRLEGGLLTALWVGLVTVPYVVSHDGLLEWLIELIEVSSGTAVGLLVARLVGQEAAERRQAQRMANRLALLHRRVVSAQEEERRRIAQELHNETAQSLVLLCRGLDRVTTTPRLPRAAQGMLRALRPLAEEALADIRRYSRDLRPTLLDDLGLAAAIQWLAADIGSRQGVQVRVNVTGLPRRLSPETEVALFRIAQEALRNVEQHAEASQVTIGLAFDEGHFRLNVHDDGKGFQPPACLNDLLAQGKLGLVAMHERSRLAGATLNLQTRPGEGTDIAVSVSE